MIDVYFHGKGDWFLKTDNGIRPVTSKIVPISHWCSEKLRSEIDDISYTSTVFRFCPEFSAVFKLTPGDEEAYSISQSKKILKKRLVKLLPSLQPGSSFLDYVEKGLLSIDDIDNSYFIIQTSVKYSQEEPAKDIKFKLKILKTDNPVNTETKKHPVIKASPKDPSQTANTTTKQKVLKTRLKDRSLLTGLIHDVLSTLSIFPGDPKPFGSKIAWEKLMIHYKNEKNLIESKHHDNRSFFLNSIDKQEVNENAFAKLYNAQFIIEK